MTSRNTEQDAAIFKALSDKARLRIIGLLNNGALCACLILKEFDFSQPTLSYHMKILTDCGLVESERQGQWIYYSLNQDKFKIVLSFFDQFLFLQ